MSAVELFAMVTGALPIGVYALRAGAGAVERSSLVFFDLRFPAGLPTEDVETFIGSLSGLLRPWWSRWTGPRHVLLEVTADERGVRHRIGASAASAHLLRHMLQANLPGVRFTELSDADAEVGALTGATSMRISRGDRSLRVDAPALSRALLTATQPLAEGESIVVQWVLTPAGPVEPARTKTAGATPGREWWAQWDDGSRPDSEATAALKAKQATPLFLATARIGVHAAGPKRTTQLLHRVEAAWHATRAPGVHLRRRYLPKSVVGSAVARRRIPVVGYPLRLNAQELAGLLGVPVEAEQIPGLVLGGCRALAASPRIATTGMVLGSSTFPGTTRPVAIDTEAQLRQTWCIGPTGTGKSTLLINMAVQDMAWGRGITVIDAKGDLCDQILSRIPRGREDDVVYLNVADDQFPVGLNPLLCSSEQLEVKVEGLVALLRSLFPQSWGPRLEQVLRASLLTLGRVPGMTIVEVGQLLTNDAFRRRLIGHLNDPVGLERFWAWFAGLSDPERGMAISPVMNKLDSALLRPRLRRVVGQAEPKLDIASVVNQGKILLVNASAGLLGEGAASLVGSIVMAELWQAVTARAALPPEQRRIHIAYLDEFQHFLKLATPIDTVLAEARGLGLGLVLAHQHLHQLPSDLRAGVLANARTKVVFQLSRGDAKVLAPELGSGLTPEDLQGIDAFEAVAQVYAQGSVAPPCTIATPPTPPNTSDPEAIREMSRRRYGRPAAEVDAEIASRSAVRTSAPVGATKRRPSGPRKGSTMNSVAVPHHYPLRLRRPLASWRPHRPGCSQSPNRWTRRHPWRRKLLAATPVDRRSGRVEYHRGNEQVSTCSGPRMHNESPKETGKRAEPGKRITARSVEAIRADLSVVDLELLDYLDHARVLTGSQFRRLMQATDRSQQRMLRLRLQRLHDLRVFGRLDRRRGGVRAGSDSFVYVLDVVGQRLLDPRPRRQWRPPWTPSLRILQHSLDVSDLYVRLIEAERSGVIDELISFETEPRCWRTFTGPSGARQILKPDAHVIIGHGDSEYHAWIELDRATESLPWIATKAQTYGQYFDTGREQLDTDVFPISWWLTPTQRRSDDLAHVLTGLPRDHRTLHRVTTLTQAIPALITEPEQDLTEGGPRT